MKNWEVTVFRTFDSSSAALTLEGIILIDADTVKDAKSFAVEEAIRLIGHKVEILTVKEIKGSEDTGEFKQRLKGS